MLTIDIVDVADVATATAIFRRDGFVCIRDALTPAQLDAARAAAERVIAEQTAATPLDAANRGFARYSFGDQLRHPEWAMLIDLPTIARILAAIWGSEDYTCSGGGGDYSLPGARIQGLHKTAPTS